MNWAREDWVRLYVRDSTQWKMLTWGARSVLLHLLRVVEYPSGWLENHHGAKGLSAMLSAPEEVVVGALEELQKAGTIMVLEGGLHMLNFCEAQKVHMEGSARQRKYEKVKRFRTDVMSVDTDGMSYKDLKSDVMSCEPDEIKLALTKKTYRARQILASASPGGRKRKVHDWPPTVVAVWEAGRDTLGWQCPSTSGSLAHIERRFRLDGYTVEQLVMAVHGAKHPDTWFQQKRCTGINHIFSKAVNVDTALEGYRRLQAGSQEAVLSPARANAAASAQRYVDRCSAEPKMLKGDTE